MTDASRAKAPVVGVLVFALITVVALTVAKWWPYSERTAALVDDRHWPGKSLLGGESGPSLRAGWDFLVAYSKSVWLALVAAGLLAGAVLTVL